MAAAFAQNNVPQDTIHVAELDIPIHVRRHPSARRFTLRVSQSHRHIVLTIPIESRLPDANTFITKNLTWLRRRLDAVPEAVPFSDGAVVPLRGVGHVVRFVGPVRGHEIVRICCGAQTDVELEVGAAALFGTAGEQGDPAGEMASLDVSGHLEHAPRRLKDWLISQARSDLSERANWHARNLGVKPKRISVRDQTSRWGSCSSNGVLSFSWRLILAPRMVLDYVAAHEAAHLEEMNHGPRFWELVAMTMPQMEMAKAWLSRHGAELHCYGAVD